MKNKNQKDKRMFFLAGALLAAPSVYFFMLEGWTSSSVKRSRLISFSCILCDCFLSANILKFLGLIGDLF
jgi:arginine exporter protein ArgO